MIYQTDKDSNLKSIHCREMKLFVLYKVEIAVEYSDKGYFWWL